MTEKIKKILIAVVAFGGVYALMNNVAKHCTESKDINNNNLYLDGIIEGSNINKLSLYEIKVNPFLDKILSFGGLVL